MLGKTVKHEKCCLTNLDMSSGHTAVSGIIFSMCGLCEPRMCQEFTPTAASVQFSSDSFSEDRNDRSPEFFMPVLTGQHTQKSEHLMVSDGSDAL